jgi:hypothetical protein
MRKKMVADVRKTSALPEHDWLNVEAIAEVEITSEDASHPIESALLPGRGPGWRAGEPGKQTIRLVFDKPQRLQHIRVDFQESEAQRTQEYVLRWSPDGGRSFRDIVRQQWNFSPDGATAETEDYCVDLSGVTVLELGITPEISGGAAVASLARMRIA